MDPHIQLDNPLENPQLRAQEFAHAQKKRRRRRLLIVAVCLIVSMLISALVAVNKGSHGFYNPKSTAAQDRLAAAQLDLLARFGNKITASDLSSFDKHALFFAVFKNAAMQTVVHTTVDSYFDTIPHNQTTRLNQESLYQSSFNYRTKELSYAKFDPLGGYDKSCVKGQAFRYQYVNLDTSARDWVRNTDADKRDCGPDTTAYVFHINDGVNTGGLSEAQAQKFTAALQNVLGLISVDDMSLAKHNGAPYIRLLLSVHPVNVQGSQAGLGAVQWAFGVTGLNGLSWPYDTVGSIASGAKIVYYINPSTKLPAYSQVQTTETTATAQTQYDFHDTVYTFGGDVPATNVDTAQPIKLSWPEEKL